MLINADFTKPATLAASDQQWIPSPQGGVERVMLDRIGAEQARATSLVRYAPGSHFPSHSHPGGEEILVLQGTFSEEGGDYPAGWYMRSPHGSRHQPSSREGATIFVKLRQMREEPQDLLRLNTADPSMWLPGNGFEVCRLYADAYETVALYRIDRDRDLPVATDAGVEILVLAGEIKYDGKIFGEYSWIRLPKGCSDVLCTGDAGATVYLKSGHLSERTAT
ncbi:TPA: cupin domain-containing protein [Stenotrophomonas maltophilia]|uniref:Cupin domain-containing protein n=1 Tax=Stenotrophomonas maltophilia TaxID=40324 RepID=A0AAJ2JEC6_STEMA|nr:cupin domain-containing protein [Stenotrophomonas maltophilia]MDT3468354.1 cupin domain-containing protein [Stenotrophomonas maltophilia]